MIKIRFLYEVKDRMRFLSNLEMRDMFERAMRRANVPLKYSQGYNPHPSISICAPLKVGVSSFYELVDVELTEKFNADQLLKTQREILPQGINLIDFKFLEKTKSLMALVKASTYVAKIPMSGVSYDTMDKKLEKFMLQDKITYEKMSKKKNIRVIDIKPMIRELKFIEMQEDGALFRMTLSIGSSGNLNVSTLFDQFKNFTSLEFDVEDIKVQRLKLYGEKNDQLIELFNYN